MTKAQESKLKSASEIEKIKKNRHQITINLWIYLDTQGPKS